MTAKLLEYKPRALKESDYSIRSRLRRQWSQINAATLEREAKTKISQDIVELRNKIIAAGKLPCG